MTLNSIRLPSIIDGFIEAITSLCHVFRDWLQNPLIEWSVLIGWNRFESCLTGFEVRAYFQAWLLYSSMCFRQNLPVTKTCWIRREFEQLSSSIAWRVIGFQSSAKKRSRAGLKGFIGPAHAKILAQVCNAATRHQIELESYPNYPRIQQVFCLKSKKNDFRFRFGVRWGDRFKWGCFCFFWPVLPGPGP